MISIDEEVKIYLLYFMYQTKFKWRFYFNVDYFRIDFIKGYLIHLSCTGIICLLYLWWDISKKVPTSDTKRNLFAGEIIFLVHDSAWFLLEFLISLSFMFSVVSFKECFIYKKLISSQVWYPEIEQNTCIIFDLISPWT